MLSFIRRLSLSQWIFIALVAGILLGWYVSSGSLSAPAAANWQQACKLASTCFLNLVKCVIVPLIFSTLVVGIAGHADDMKAMGRIALKAIVYFEIVTTLALFVGLAAVNLVEPGKGAKITASADIVKGLPQGKVTIESVVEHLFPHSLFDSASRNDILQVVIYAVIFGIALSKVKGRPREVVLEFFDSISQVMFKFTALVMLAAPIGVFGAIGYTVGHNGVGVLGRLVMLVGTLYGALLVFILIVLVPIMWICRIPVLKFFKTIREPSLLAFTTATSEAALPDAMRLMEKFGVPRRIVSFVMPTGYSFNLDGSTLHLAVASVFVAQAAGIHLDLQTQITMMLTLMLTSKGVAAVPRASQVILAGTLASFNLPVDGMALILGVDAFMDMARTTVNLIGNCLASAVVARWEGELNLRADEPDVDVGAFG